MTWEQYRAAVAAEADRARYRVRRDGARHARQLTVAGIRALALMRAHLQGITAENAAAAASVDLALALAALVPTDEHARHLLAWTQG